MSLFWAALSVATLHALLPVHWLPYVTVARSKGWPVRRLIIMNLLGTFIHLASTIAITALAFLLSYATTHRAGHAMEWAGAALLLMLATLYLFFPAKVEQWSGKLSWMLAVGVGIQPCIELIPLMLVAAISGTAATLIVGATWAITTIALSLVLVVSAYYGLTLGWTKRLQPYAYVITGLVLLVSGGALFWHAH